MSGSKKGQRKFWMKLKFERSLDQFFGYKIKDVQEKIAASSELDPELDNEHKEEHLA
jgi:hypothetical protein